MPTRKPWSSANASAIAAQRATGFPLVHGYGTNAFRVYEGETDLLRGSKITPYGWMPSFVEQSSGQAGAGTGNIIYALRDGAQNQIDLAKAGNWITDPRSASTSSFLKTSTNTIGAHYKAAFWKAVAARIMHDANFATDAEGSAHLGYLHSTMFGALSSTKVSDIQAITTEAAQHIKDRATARGVAVTKGSPIGWILTVMGLQVDPARIEAAKASAAATSGTTLAKESAAGVVEDISSTTAWLRDRAKDIGGSSSKWWFWPIVLGGGALVTVTLLAFFARPYAGVAREAYGDVRSGAQKVYADARTARANPKKKKRRHSRGKTRR